MLKTKRIVSIILVFVSLISLMLPVAVSATTSASEISTVENQKVSDELLEVMQVSYEELTSADFTDDGTVYPCIIWIEDIDKEAAVKAGIDAAELTREVVATEYAYPYEIKTTDGISIVEVDFDDSESDVYVQTYIEAERAAASDMYESQNGSFVAEHFGINVGAGIDDELSINNIASGNQNPDINNITYISRYSPCIFADLKISDILYLCEQDSVRHIGYWMDDVEWSNDTETATTYATTTDLIILQQNIRTLSIDDAKSTYGVSGSGIKIGQYELVCPTSANVIKNPNASYEKGIAETNHANNVYAIMQYVASDATYYASGMYSESEDSTHVEHIEWLLSQGVNIINMSATNGGSTNTYTEVAKWFDHIACNHNVHFVKSSGNKGNDEGITSPGMAYNIITVGNTSYSAPYSLYESSSYYNGTSSVSDSKTHKPDLVAPGTYATDVGTSYSAPLVSGVIALLCEQQPTLKTKPFSVKSILASSTSDATRSYITEDTDFRQYGAGMLDAYSAMGIISNGDHVQGMLTVSQTSTIYSRTVSDPSTILRVALTYSNTVEFSGDIHSMGIDGGTIGEFVLEIIKDGIIIDTCSVAGANLKVLEIDTEVYGTGTYTARIRRISAPSGNRQTYFGLAFRR